jgi:hypothetical protein
MLLLLCGLWLQGLLDREGYGQSLETALRELGQLFTADPDSVREFLALKDEEALTKFLKLIGALPGHLSPRLHHHQHVSCGVQAAPPLSCRRRRGSSRTSRTWSSPPTSSSRSTKVSPLALAGRLAYIHSCGLLTVSRLDTRRTDKWGQRVLQGVRDAVAGVLNAVEALFDHFYEWKKGQGTTATQRNATQRTTDLEWWYRGQWTPRARS